jgi:hypothetical protein
MLFGTDTNYTVVSTNGTLILQKSIAVTVIADGKSKKYTGMKILRLLCGYWCCQWRTINIPTTTATVSNVGLSY